MAKKKKHIVHFRTRSKSRTSFCGTKSFSSAFFVEKTNTIKQLLILTDSDERLCHKCKHIHKLNLAKVK